MIFFKGETVEFIKENLKINYVNMLYCIDADTYLEKVILQCFFGGAQFRAEIRPQS